MLKNTLILPESDVRLAATLLRDAIDNLKVVIMLVFGKEAEAKQIVDWADQLCEKTQVTSDYNLRRVVWIREPSSASLRAVLDPLVGEGNTPRATVLNFSDVVKGTLEQGVPVNPTALEDLFALGHQK